MSNESMSDNKFWVLFWTILGLVAFGLIGTIGGCVYKSSERNAQIVAEAIQKGEDPIKAKCATLIGSFSTMTTGEAAICGAASKK